MTTTDPDDAHGQVRHEPDAVSFPAILGSGAALMAAGLVAAVFVWIVFLVLSSREAGSKTRIYPLATEEERRLPPEPRLQTTPRQDLIDLRTQEDRALSTYGWVDRAGGVVRIPIDEAMKLTVSRGLPTRPAERTPGGTR